MSDSYSKNRKKGGMFRGIVWVAGSRVAVRALGLISTVVLARLLTPEDFGLVAIAMSVVGLLRGFTELRFSHALIHYQDATDNDYCTAWTLNCLRGVILTVAVIALSYPVSLWFNDDRLMWIFVFLALIPLLDGFENPRIIAFEKELRFDVLFHLMVITKVAGVTAAIVGAVVWQSYWALVVGMVVTNLARTIVSFFLAPARVRPTFASFRKLIRFSGWLSGAEVMGALGNRLNPAILAAFTSPHVVGIFHVARELTWITFNEVAAPLRRVLFPALSRHETGSTPFVSAYTQSVAGLFMILAPVSLGFSLTADDFVPLVLGNQWLPAIQPIQWIAAALVISITGRVAESAVMAAGRTRMLFYRTLMLVPIKLSLFVSGAAMAGLPGAVAGIIIGMIIDTTINLRMGAIVTGVSMLRHLMLPARSWLALAGMAMAVVATDHLLLFTTDSVGHALALAAQIGAGALSYSLIQFILWHRAGRPVGPEQTFIDATSWIMPPQMRRWLAV